MQTTTPETTNTAVMMEEKTPTHMEVEVTTATTTMDEDDVKTPEPATAKVMNTNKNVNVNTPVKEVVQIVNQSVSIENFAFNSKNVTVKKGAKITFTNKDSVAHTVTSDNGKFDSGLFGQGKSFTLDTATLAAGTYNYLCTPHPNMKGTIVVE